MATLEQLRVSSPVLTNLAYGYHNPVLVGEALMPIVEIEKEAGKIPKFGREAFRMRSTIRHIRQNSNVIDPEDLDSIDVTLDEHDLAYPVDYREINDASIKMQAYALKVVQDNIFLMREKQVADLAFDDTKYAADNKLTLTGTDQFNDPASDPFAVVESARKQIQRLIGHYPTTAVIPQDVFDFLKTHPKVVEKLKYLQLAKLTTETLASWFEVPNISIGAAVIADNVDNLTPVWSKHMVLAYVPENDPKGGGRTIYEPAYGYTVRRKHSLMVDTYEKEGGKILYVRCTDIMRPHILGADAGFLVKDAIA